MAQEIKKEDIKKGDVVLIKSRAVEVRNGIVDLEFLSGKKTKIFMARPGVCKIQVFPEDNMELLRQTNE